MGRNLTLVLPSVMNLAKIDMIQCNNSYSATLGSLVHFQTLPRLSRVQHRKLFGSCGTRVGTWLDQYGSVGWAWQTVVIVSNQNLWEWHSCARCCTLKCMVSNDGLHVARHIWWVAYPFLISEMMFFIYCTLKIRESITSKEIALVIWEVR